jgi:uncharacterized protein YueI
MEKKNKDILEETLMQSYHGVPQIKPEEQNKYLGTYKERVIFVLLKEEISNKDKHIEINDALNNPNADIILINSKNIKELSGFINIAREKGIKHRVVSREEGTTEVALVIASNKAL